jgi:hypothetical protein
MEKTKITAIEKGETGEEQIKSMLVIFFDVISIVHKEFGLAENV